MMEHEPGVSGAVQAWDARLETGVVTLDLQHRVLFDLVRRTHEAVEAGLGLNLADLLQQLRAYADYHFRYEEDWVRRHCRQRERSPADLCAHDHAHLHMGFVTHLDGLEARLRQGQLEVGSVHDFLQRWLVDHILCQDVPMIRALLKAAPPQRPPA